jgi:hypothetical protein
MKGDAEDRAEARRLSTLLLAGHGAALLVIFNARASGALAASDALRGVALNFAIGLVCAFWMHFLLLRQGQRRSEPLALLESEGQRNVEQGRRAGWVGGLMLASAGSFLIGLLSAIEFLGPAAD